MSKHEKNVGRSGMVAAGLAIMVFATTAGASPIRFDNPAPGEPGYFDWFGAGIGDTRALDITVPAGDQTGIPGVGAFEQQNQPTYTWVTGYIDERVQATPDPFLIGVDAGEPIPISGFGWFSGAFVNYPGYSSPFPYDVPTYAAVSIDLGSGDQYGWIGVVFSSADFSLDAFAWGYETEPGVPIPAGIPEPGSLALLALAAVAATTRRRQRGN